MDRISYLSYRESERDRPEVFLRTSFWLGFLRQPNRDRILINLAMI